MKKALLIISILSISIIFLSGCSGIFNLNGWICPDDLEFLEVVEELDSPQKIGDYMQANFTYGLHKFYAPDPYVLWKTKKGDCNDFSTFGVFVAHYHGYKTYQINIFYIASKIAHFLAVYVEDDGLSFTDNQYYFNNYGYWFTTFREIVEFDCKFFPGKELKKYVVKDYENNIAEEGYK